VPFPVTSEVRDILDDLARLRAAVEPRLGFASPLAREEWGRVCARIPRREEVASGFVAITEEELADMRGRISRFNQILTGLDPAARPAGREHQSGAP
jgi:hypothetical protein